MELSRYASRLASPNVPNSSRLVDLGKSEDSEEVSASLSEGRFAEEPDDASLTGGTRSLSRRLLALNIPAMRQGAKVARNSILKPSKVRQSALEEKAAH